MSTRATVYIHGTDGAMDIKLYHHWDGYVEYLGRMLDKALQKWRRAKMRDTYGYKSKNLIEYIANIGGFEQARPVHGDVEYVYHIHYGIDNKWNSKKGKNDIIVSYRLECQAGMEYGEDKILKRPMTLLSQNWDGEKKELNRKKAEIELGCKEKYIDGYLDE